MQTVQHADVAVIGGGIVGLTTAYHLASRGRKVVLFERNTRAVGASIRNFGLIWPIGQAPGRTYTRAIRSREIWHQIAQEAGFWQVANGSLHLAYETDELHVLEEFVSTAAQQGYQGCTLLSHEAVLQKSPGVRATGLKGGLWSDTEMTVDPREVVATLPGYLEAAWGVTLRYGTAVNSISLPYLETKDGKWQVDEVFVCSGADFETLYPHHFAQQPITKCKLQMMRTAPQPHSWQLGPTLCGGLTLRHYAAFRHCQSLQTLDQRVSSESPWFDQWGIHVMVAQNGLGELVIGDSHEYGPTPDPFDKEEVNQIILKYLHTFAQAPNLEIVSRWHGVYPKLTNGGTEIVLHPEPNVTIINGLGGAGMTLSFGLTEEVVSGTYVQPIQAFQSV